MKPNEENNVYTYKKIITHTENISGILYRTYVFVVSKTSKTLRMYILI